MRKRRLRLGVAGLGRGFMLMLPTLAQHPKLKLVAAADPRPEARVRFAADFHARAFETVGELCRDPDVEAIYIATPHQFHVEHVKLAAGAGKHVLVEKPMALSLTECRAMIEAARRGGIKIVVGHSHSFDRPYLRAREIIEEGHLGAVRMITALNYTDFLYRPRRPEELNTSEGGGVVWSQAAHQVDIVRLLAGGRVRTVRAATGRWDPARSTEGAYSAFLTFEEGAFATLAYSGYGHFDSDEFGGWIGELGQTRQDRKYGEARRKLRTIKSPAEEAELKKTRFYGVHASAAAQYTKPHAHNHFGLIVISCERGDLRPVPNGVRVYTDDAEFLDMLPAGQVPRSEVIDELYDAAVDNRPTLHSGEWGLATTEVCLAILQSAAEGRELVLHQQVAALSINGK